MCHRDEDEPLSYLYPVSYAPALLYSYQAESSSWAPGRPISSLWLSAASLVTFAAGVCCFRVTVPRLTAAKSRKSLILSSGQKSFQGDRSPKSRPPTVMQEPVACKGSVSPPCQTSACCLFCLSQCLFQFLWDRCSSSIPLLNSIACCAKQLQRQMCLFFRTAPISSPSLLLHTASGQKKKIPNTRNPFRPRVVVNKNKGDSSGSPMGQRQTWPSRIWV